MQKWFWFNTGLGNEVLSVLLTVAVGFSVCISGVGGALYVSYFGCVFMLVATMVYFSDVFFDTLGREDNVLGSPASVYNYVSCVQSDEGNKEYSTLTFTSSQGMMQGIVIVLGLLMLCIFIYTYIDILVVDNTRYLIVENHNQLKRSLCLPEIGLHWESFLVT